MSDQKNNVVFRCDSSAQMGAGHLMRCLTLAETLEASGKNCSFVCRDHPGNLAHIAEDRGFQIRMLPVISTRTTRHASLDLADSRYTKWLGADWEQDSADVIASLAGSCPQWLVTDHYAIDHRWESSMRPHCDRILSIDDLADRKHDCDLLIDQTLGREDNEYRALVPEGCHVMTGAQFALLRPGFAKMRQDSLERRKRPELRHILIAMGASDPENITGKILACLAEFATIQNFGITMMLSSSAPHIESVRRQVDAAALPVTIVIDAKNIPEILAEADLALGAAGSSAWERCCLGVPSLMAVLADNQRRIAQELERAGAALLFDPSDCDVLRRQILRLSENPSALAELSQKASLVTDGRGSEHVALYMARGMS